MLIKLGRQDRLHTENLWISIKLHLKMSLLALHASGSWNETS